MMMPSGYTSSSWQHSHQYLDIVASQRQELILGVFKMAGLNVAGIIQLLIFLIVGGAIWYLFKLFAPKVGLPDIVVQVLPRQIR